MFRQENKIHEEAEELKNASVVEVKREWSREEH
jgi:hypothetical protein